jgi:Tfp pilus assembly protein PilF
MDEAIAEFDHARKSEPERAFPLWSLANIYEDRGDWAKAEQLYASALEREPDDVVANMNFGRMLKKKGEPGIAKLYLERALLLDPDYEAAKTLLLELELKD